MSWPFETQRQRHGLTPEEWALPPTLVATFQKEVYRRLLERSDVDAESSGPTSR